MELLFKYVKIFSLLFFFGSYSNVVFAQTLQDYLQLAEENNPGLKAEYAAFEAALQELPQVSSLPDPVLTMSAFGNMVETRMGPQEAKFSLMQMFPWFGTLKTKENVAQLIAEAEFQKYLNSQNWLFFRISQKYYELYELQEKIRFQTENLKIIKDFKDLALAKVRSGSGALADVLQTDLFINEIRTTLEILEREQNTLKVKFNVLLNRNSDAPIKIPAKLIIQPENLVTANDSVFENHPRMVAIEKMKTAAQFQKELAEKKGMPSFGLGVEYSIIGERMDMEVPGSGKDAFMPMVSVSLPIFRKKYKAAQKQAQFMQESYSEREKEIQNELISEYADVVFKLQKSVSMINLYKKQIESTEQVLNLSLSAYQNSTVGFKEVLELRQELLKFQVQKAAAEVSFLSARAQLKYLKNTF